MLVLCPDHFFLCFGGAFSSPKTQEKAVWARDYMGLFPHPKHRKKRSGHETKPMPSDKHNSRTARARDLISSLINVTSS